VFEARVHAGHATAGRRADRSVYPPLLP
jgi:hypothetical protein